MTIRKRCATGETPSVRSLVDVVGSQYRQTEGQRQTNVACVNSSAHPAGSSVLFIGPSSSCALSPQPLHHLLHFSPIQKRFPQSFLLPLNLLVYTHSHAPEPSTSVHFLSAGQHCLL